jgi:hypothetical protein
MGRTFSERYCEAHGCAQSDFPRRIFWKCLHRRAIPWAPLILAVNPRYFAADRELASSVGRATDMNRVWEEVRAYFVSPRNAGWLRRRAGFRLSARKLVNCASELLPSSGSPPSAYTVAGDEGLR